MRFGVVMAFYGRHDLTRLAMIHMMGVLGPDHAFVAVGSEGDESRTVVETSAAWGYIEAPNRPLSNKYNAGLRALQVEADFADIDAVIVMGSDNFCAPRLIDTYAKGIEEDYDLQGLSDLYFYRAINGASVHWDGYSQASGRHGETLGTFRCFSRALLDKVGWKLWPDGLDKSIDCAMMERLEALSPRVRAYTMKEAGAALDVKSDRNLTTWWATAAARPRVEIDEWVDEIDPPEELFDVGGMPGAPQGESGLVTTGMVARIDKGLETEVISALRSSFVVTDDAFVLMDDRSTADAVPIVRLAHHTWRDFSHARNALHEHVITPWIFVLDADELLVHPGNLRETIKRAEETGMDGVAAMCQTVGDSGPDSEHWQIRAYRKDRGVWRYPIHNELVGIDPDKILQSNAVIESSYEGTMKEKNARSIPPLLEMMEKDPKNARWPYHIAQHYSAVGDDVNAITYATRSLLIDKQNPSYAWAWGLIAAAYMHMGEYKTAAMFLRHASALYPWHPDFHHMQACLALTDWWMSCEKVDHRAKLVSKTMRYVHVLPRLSSALGFPMQWNTEEE